jgi:urocanate hydratase
MAETPVAIGLGGLLLVHGDLDREGAAAALAGNIAGAATLGIDGDGSRLKQGVRHGFCDFLVNNLDEALRILKNEIRKKQPVSVCFEGVFASFLQVFAERGVQPDILAFSGKKEDSAVLIERGATVLRTDDSVGDSRLDVAWAAETRAALWLPKVDALAAEVLPAEDARRRWLKFAPRYLGRSLAGRRYLRMSAGELESFRGRVESAMAVGEIGTRVTISS